MPLLSCYSDIPEEEDPLVGGVAKSQRLPWATQDTSLSHGAFFLLKERIQCFCEGGRNCKKEDPKANKCVNAVRGVHSSWVGSHIIAAARPQQHIIESEDTLEDFREKNVKGIINLQEIGEHSNCGSGVLKQSGFSYDPDYFMEAGVCVYNFPAVDMNSPGMTSTLNTVQIIDFHVRRNEVVLVHCHAGLGRTGTMIACYFVFAKGMSPEDAISLVRNNREKSIETKSQILLVYQFARYICSQYKHFPLAFIRKELDKNLQRDGTKNDDDSDGKSSAGDEEEKQSSTKQKILDRLTYLEEHCQKCLGKGSIALKRSEDLSFEEALEGQERLLHGKERRQHPTVPWKLAESLHRLKQTSAAKTGLGNVLENQMAGILACQETTSSRSITLKVLELEIDFHSSNWQSCASLSLEQTLQLLDQWLVSLPATGFDYTRMEEEVNSEEFRKGGVKKMLLQCYPRQLALTLYVLVVCLAFLVHYRSEKDDSTRTSPLPEEGLLFPNKNMQAAGDWISRRLLGKGKESLPSEGEISQSSQLLLKLAGHVAVEQPDLVEISFF